MLKILNVFFSRLVITGISILLQAFLFIFLLWRLSDKFIYIYIVFLIISLLITMYIINKNDNPSFKIPWIVLILTVPLLGGILYVLIGHHYFSKKSKLRWQKIYQKSKLMQPENKNMVNKLKEDNIKMANQSEYISKYANNQVFTNTKTKYYSLGDLAWIDMLSDLKNAKKFIFIEYFIIQEGEFWESILNVLKQKAREGVDVRVMYDDLGCIALLPSKYHETLEACGIKCIPFNRFIPILSVFHNNRDHRKIMVIDGNIGYTGGINLADEYVNKKIRHGHWKDSCIRIEGEAVKNLTILFLESWDYYRNEDNNYMEFLPAPLKIKDEGYVQPYGDNPLDKESIGKNVYLNIIDQAEKYLYINTPYLIVDYDMIDSLCRAAKRGVEVKMMLPHIADKWYVHIITRSFYDTLITAGVKIYEYKPGFIHAKSFVADDEVGVIGTINLDYRSLVHHFECAVWLYKTSTIKELKEDFIKTLNQGVEIKLHDANKIPGYMRWIRGFIKFFAPLM